ncbi:MAG: hypothetical protein R2882_11560 [Gemmatimonadales bacterium]
MNSTIGRELQFLVSHSVIISFDQLLLVSDRSELPEGSAPLLPLWPTPAPTGSRTLSWLPGAGGTTLF